MKKNINSVNSKFFVVLMTLLGFAYSCTPESNLKEGIRIVDFKATADANLIIEGESIMYKDSSLNVSSRTWTFEGGSISSSDQEQVNVTYEEEGTFPTSLEVNFQGGEVKNHTFNVRVFPHIEAQFSADKNAARFDDQITFTNESVNFTSFENDDPETFADEFIWSFEGGVPATSTEADPVITYPTPGVYSVTLTAKRGLPAEQSVMVKNDFIQIVDVDVLAATVELVDLGTKILVTYTAPLGPIADDSFTVTIDGEEAALSSVEVDGTDPNSYALVLETPVTEGQVISLSYGGGDFATTGELLGTIVDLGVENTFVNVFAPGNFEGITTSAYGYSGWMSVTADDITFEVNETAGVEGSSALVFSAPAGTVAGSKKTIFGDAEKPDNVQLITPLVDGETYLVKAKVKYVGVAPSEIRLSMFKFPWSNESLTHTNLEGSLMENEWVDVEGEFVAKEGIQPDAYAVPNVTFGAGESVVSIDEIKVYKK